MIDLTPDEARRIILRAQGLLGSDSRRGGVPAMLRRLGAVQLDTISVLARSHELVAYARLGPVGRPAVERAYWDSPARSFEYWCHAACLLPIEHWPLYAFRRRAYRERRYRWHQVPDSVGDLLQQVRDSGPLTTADVGGAKNGGPWWDWSDAKIGLEWLLDIGEIVCTRRVGWRRVYDLAERVVPADLLAEDLSDEECITRLATIAGRSLGVATRSDLIDFLRLRGSHAAILDEALASGAAGLTPVRVHGWPEVRTRGNGTNSGTRSDSGSGTGTGTGTGSGTSGADTGAHGNGTGGARGNDTGGANAQTHENVTSRGNTLAHGNGTSGATTRARGTGTGGANAWADPAALESEPRGRHRTTLVSPFDSLIWYRSRVERVFGFNYQLELYVPKHKRVHGYYTMPVLAGGRLIGRVDPAREGTTLVARKLSLEPGLTSARWVEAMREALWSAAAWVGCDNVRVEHTDPPELAAALNAAPAH